MIIVGQVSSREEAEEIEYISRLSVIANRARALAGKTKKNENVDK
jgi:hypothetical protein